MLRPPWKEIDKLLIQDGKLDEMAVVSLGHILSREAGDETALAILKEPQSAIPRTAALADDPGGL